MHEVAHIRRQLAEIAQPVEHAHLRVAQDAEAAYLGDFGDGVGAAALEGELPVAEIGEVVVIEPAQELEAFGDLRDRKHGRPRLQLSSEEHTSELKATKRI